MATFKLLRGAAIVLFACGVVCSGAWGVLWGRYYDKLPRSPQPATGRTYEMNMGGVAVYATSGERHQLDMVGNISLVLLVSGVVGCFLTDRDYRRKMGWRDLGSPPPAPPGQGEGSG